MADCVDVIRQFERMCKANAGCINCPLDAPDGVSYTCSIHAFVNNPEHIEHEVMSWAEKHPEPVYPTWAEWLVDSGVFPEKMSTIPSVAFNTIRDSLSVEIPAEIAQKLGIEPKEDV